jgi:hypothetical protein
MKLFHLRVLRMSVNYSKAVSKQLHVGPETMKETPRMVSRIPGNIPVLTNYYQTR